MPAKRKTDKCPLGHELTGDNVRIRKDRNGAIEFNACAKLGRKRFTDKNPLYDTWKTMWRRCEDPTFKDWSRYGGKEPPVTVCERWRLYDLFASDIGPKPSPVHTLDRRDGNQGYRPDNCCWATPKEQSRHRADNRIIAFDGKALTISEWSELTGLKYLTIFARLKRGWSIEKTLTGKLIPNVDIDHSHMRTNRDPTTGKILPKANT